MKRRHALDAAEVIPHHQSSTSPPQHRDTVASLYEIKKILSCIFSVLLQSIEYKTLFKRLKTTYNYLLLVQNYTYVTQTGLTLVHNSATRPPLTTYFYSMS